MDNENTKMKAFVVDENDLDGITGGKKIPSNLLARKTEKQKITNTLYGNKSEILEELLNIEEDEKSSSLSC